MRVNLEVFVLYNAAMNALLLLCTGRLSSLKVKAWKLALAALFGAAYAVVSVSAALFLQTWYWRLTCAFGMAALAFCPSHPRRILRAGACFFLCAALMGGTGFSLLYLMGARGFGWGIAGLLAALGAVGCVALSRGWRRTRMDTALRKVTILYGGQRAVFTAMIDTGNHLYEPLSGLPVMVVERSALEGIRIPEGRPIAFSSMAGAGTLGAFEPDAVLIDGREGERVAVAAYDGLLSGQKRYSALLPFTCVISLNKTISKCG